MLLDEKNELIKSLEFANTKLIKKHGDAYLDKVIDTVSKGRYIDAEKHVDEFIEKNNIKVDVLPEKQKKGGLVNVSSTTRPLVDKKLAFKKEFIDKIKELDKLLTEKNVLNLITACESSSKEYGFGDWFNIDRELNIAIIDYSTSKETDKTKRIDVLRKIKNLKKQLEEKTKDFNTVLDFIKNKFDINKTGLPLNLYSGRPRNNTGNLKDFYPDFPKILSPSI